MRFSLALTIVLCLWSGSASAQRLDPDWENWPAFVQDLPIEVSTDEDDLTRLQRESYNACLDELRERYNYWLQGGGGPTKGITLEEVCNNADRLLALRLEIGLTPAEEIQLQAERLEFAKRTLEQVKAKRALEHTFYNNIDEKFARTYRLVAEKELLRTRKKADAPRDGS